jgi:flagellar biosynthesis protein FlhB
MSERTQPATPKRRKDARRDGDLAKSPTLTAACSQFGWLIAMHGLGAWSFLSVVALIGFITGLDWSLGLHTLYVDVLTHVLAALVPLAVGAIALGIVTTAVPELIQTRGAFPWKRVTPDITRLNPVNGAKRMFGLDTLAEFGVMLMQLVLSCTVAALAVHAYARELPSMLQLPVLAQASLIGLALLGLFARMTGSQLLPALVHATLRHLLWLRRLRMSHADVRREHRDDDGDPHLKSERRARYRQIVK